jgi:hypothetical protein
MKVRAAIGRRAPGFARRVAVRRGSASADAELERIVSESRPLLVGPWLSEVGFELLYWIPLLRWLLREHGVPPSEVVAISRGGVETWYANVANGYVELLGHLEPADIAALRLRRRCLAGSEKQGIVLPEERTLVEAIAVERGLHSYGWLHPRLMYRLFERSWSWDGDVGHVLARTTHEPFAAPELADLAALLPKEPYVAVKAYFSDLALPHNAADRRALDELIAFLAERLPVVLLGIPVALDEHEQLSTDRCLVLRDELEPARNLAQQTAVVARAVGLVSTYGGFSYLGPHLGIPTLAVAGRTAYNPFHARLFRNVLGRLGDPAFEGPVSLNEVRASALGLLRLSA